MKISCIEFDYLAHVCFRFKSPGGRTLITDPLFTDSYEEVSLRTGKRTVQKFLTPPEVPIESITACDVVSVSHEHRDHLDPEAVMKIQSQTGAKVLAPADVLDILAEEGADRKLFLLAEDGKAYHFGDLTVRSFGRYDNSADAKGRPNKFALLVESGETRFFYSGDCHHIPPGVKGAEVDAMFCWPHTNPKRLQQLCADLDAKRFVIMHCDRFEPGEFMCNMDPEEQRARVTDLVPDIDVIVPERASEKGF